MEVTYPRCAGLDVHKKLVVACVLTPEGRETRSFGTMTSDLLKLADWLVERQVTHVAMESTGVYWKPIYNVLEGLEELTVWVVNAQHIKAVPGRKTDVKDAEWIADLLHHGLVRGSYIPDRGQRELRELVRHRRTLIQERSRVVNRLQKVLEGANIKLSSVVSDVTGVSGRAMLQALATGEERPEALADLARGRLQEKRPVLEEALRGVMGSHQRLMLQSHLRHLAFLESEVDRLSKEVAERMRPFEEAMQRLDDIPGLGPRTLQDLLAETGLDMTRFPSDGHFASWAKVCPGNHQSAGKRRSSSIGHGNRWLRAARVEAAWAAVRTKDSYFGALYRRIAARRGGKRAILAVAHALLVTLYHLLRTGQPYRDLGRNYFDERHRLQTVHRAVRRIERLGYHVTLDAA